MAATRLIALHQNKGKNIAQSLGNRTAYAKNPDKTEEGELVFSRVFTRHVYIFKEDSI